VNENAERVREALDRIEATLKATLRRDHIKAARLEDVSTVREDAQAQAEERLWACQDSSPTHMSPGWVERWAYESMKERAKQAEALADEHGQEIEDLLERAEQAERRLVGAMDKYADYNGLRARIQELEALLAEYEREGPPPSNVQLREAVQRAERAETLRLRETLRLNAMREEKLAAKRRIQTLEAALGKLADDDIPWADGARRIGYHSASDFQAYARQALAEDEAEAKS
jgi:DNA repair exonuclease SbcCD ATPase subunit